MLGRSEVSARSLVRHFRVRRVRRSEPNLGVVPTAVARLDVDEGVDTVGNLGGHVMVDVLITSHGQPLGRVRVPVHGDRCPGHVLVEHVRDDLGPQLLRQRLVTVLEQPHAERRLDIESLARVPVVPTDDSRPLLSMTVAVCTRDRAELVADCLEALERMRHPVDVLVVDNAPTSTATADLVARRFPSVGHVVEPRAGLDHARNRAIAETTTDVLAFTDDDVEVDPNWSAVVVRAFEAHPELAALTGLVVPAELETPSQEVFERLGSFGTKFVRRWETRATSSGRRRVDAWDDILAAGQFGAGANMAYRRSEFDRIGGFDPALGAGTPAGGGDDLEMFHRVLAADGVLRYEPAAIVRHRHRRTMPELREQMTANGALWSMMASARAGRRARTRQVVRVMHWYARRWWAGRILRAAIIPERVPLRLPLAEVAGTVGSAIRRDYRRSQRAHPEPASPPIPVRATAPTASGDCSGPRWTLVVDVLGEVRSRDVPLGTSMIDVVVMRGRETLGTFEVETGGHPVPDDQLRERIVDEFGVQLLADGSNGAGPTHDEAIAAVVAGLVVRDERPTVAPVIDVTVVVTPAHGAAYDATVESVRRHATRHRVDVIDVAGVAAGSGPNAVRNAAIRASSGEVVVTLDAGVHVCDGWLDRLLGPLERNDVMAVCGAVSARDESPADDRVATSSNWTDPRSRFRPCPVRELGSAANAAFRVAVRDHPAIGVFDERLDPGDGTELLYRIVRAGYTVIRDPSAVGVRAEGPIAADGRAELRHHLATLRRWRDPRAVVGIAGTVGRRSRGRPLESGANTR